MPQHVYLDASVILPQLWQDADTDLEERSKSITQDLRGAVRIAHDIRVKLPQIAIGECAMRFIEDLRGGAVNNTPPEDLFMENLSTIVESTSAELVSISPECSKIAVELHDLEPFITGNDLLIAGHVIEDRYASHLLNTDSALLDSRAIPKMCRARDHRHGVRVSNRYQRD